MVFTKEISIYNINTYSKIILVTNHSGAKKIYLTQKVDSELQQLVHVIVKIVAKL